MLSPVQDVVRRGGRGAEALQPQLLARDLTVYPSSRQTAGSWANGGCREHNCGPKVGFPTVASSPSSGLLLFRMQRKHNMRKTSALLVDVGPIQKKGLRAPWHTMAPHRRGVVDNSIAAFLQFFGPQQMDAFLRVGLQAQGSAPWFSSEPTLAYRGP